MSTWPYNSLMDQDLERLARLLKQAQYRQHRAIDAALVEIGTTIVQWDALRAIASAPGASAHALAAASFQTDQAFGVLAQRLLARRLIERSPGKGRRIEHRLSAEGQRLLSDGNRIVDRVRKELYKVFPQADRDRLAELLSAFTKESIQAD